METFDKDIQELAKKAISAQSEGKSIWDTVWKAVVSFGILLTIWYLKRQLDSTSKELAKAKAEAELMKIKAEDDRYRAAVFTLGGQANKAIKEAEARIVAAEFLIEGIDANEAKLAQHKADIESIRNLEDLNRIAGITP